MVEALTAKLEAKGAKTLDSSLLVEEIRVVKSPREVAVMREAAAMADTALEAVRAQMCPGMSETEIEGVLIGSLMSQGCNYPAIHTMVGSGIRSGTHHSAPTHRKVREGDLVHFDFLRFTASLSRQSLPYALGGQGRRSLARVDGEIGRLRRPHSH